MATRSPRGLPPTCSQRPVHVTFVGDSLAVGWGASNPRYTFTSRVFQYIDTRRPHSTMLNLGAPGQTSDEIATHQVPLIRRQPCSLIVIIAGANDVQKFYTPAHFERSYQHLLHEAHGRDPQKWVAGNGST
ncbi:MAG: SGNH/GDSL hydrolase family protein [Candidatus Eremiobacteraeota bacterium]|nr:SGNH/GDSL hydrolase family protein [Candidatus Eremiobacteraeota bacterium]